MKTFKCNFGKKLSCEVHVPDVAPPHGSKHIQKIEWSGKPTLKVIRPYIAWMNSVNQTLADEWGIKIMHVFQTSPTTVEAWSYEPGKPPELIK